MKVFEIVRFLVLEFIAGQARRTVPQVNSSNLFVVQQLELIIRTEDIMYICTNYNLHLTRKMRINQFLEIHRACIYLNWIQMPAE